MMKRDYLKFIGTLVIGITAGVIIEKLIKSKDTSDTDDILIVDKSDVSVCPNDEGEPDIL